MTTRFEEIQFPAGQSGPPQEPTAEQLLEKLLTDLALCITLLNLKLKWLRADATVPLAELAETTAMLEQMTQMQAKYEADRAQLRRSVQDNAIRFPTGEK